MKKYYFDYAATTPIALSVLDAMMPYLQNEYGNAGSLHEFGHDASKALLQAREQVAEFLNCKMQEVYFTSGATESNNIALQGVLEKGDHLIISSIEHPSVYEVAKALEERGIEVSYLPVQQGLDGRLDHDVLADAIKDNTRLVSIMYVNNEIGVVQDIAGIAALIGKINDNRGDLQPILFHTDATQGAPYLTMNVQELGVDLLSFSGHKIYGPKGVGVLYVRQGVEVRPCTFGGGQELGLRPGTENISSIVGLADATRYVIANNHKLNELQEWRDQLYELLVTEFDDMTVYGAFDYTEREKFFLNRIPTNLNISFDGIEAEQLVYLLDAQGVAVSSVSACSSKALKPSRVILAIGGSQQQARSTIRITLGLVTTYEEVQYLYTTLIAVIKKIRS